MKKISIIVSLVLVVIAILLFIQLRSAQTRIRELTRSALSACPQCPAYDSEFKGITLQTAKEMADLYSSNHHARLVPLLNMQNDARSVWFSLERLKKFIWTLERRVCSNPCIDSLGIRIYFGEYPDLQSSNNSDYNGIDPGYKGMHTLFMVPTYKDNGIHWDFSPIQISDTVCKPQPLVWNFFTRKYDTINYMKVGEDALILAPDADNLNMNHGSLFPPKKRDGEAF